MASPLLGYNTNVRHHGKLYHIQTEDSGVKHPHIITHLFADGGRIIASKKTTYGELVSREDMKDVVKQMMRDQHKAMFIALRDGEFDDEGSEPTQEVKQAPPDVDALEAAAARLAGAAPIPSDPPPSAPPKSKKYQETMPAHASVKPKSSLPPSSIFGSDLLTEKSLDEVILADLAEHRDDEG